MTIDWDEVRAVVDHQDALLMDLIDIFFVEKVDVVPRIAGAIEARDADALRLYAHRFKGCLRYFGVSRAVQLAEQLEDAGRNARLDEVPAVFDALRDEVERLETEIRSYREQHGCAE